MLLPSLALTNATARSLTCPICVSCMPEPGMQMGRLAAMRWKKYSSTADDR